MRGFCHEPREIRVRGVTKWASRRVVERMSTTSRTAPETITAGIVETPASARLWNRALMRAAFSRQPISTTIPLMHLIGLDIGFSARSRTNALAEIENGELRVVKLNVEERDAELERAKDVDVIAIDAPIVPEGCALTEPRLVEQIFCRGIFQKRCKPGASHVAGTGHQLRSHGSRAAALIANAARWDSALPFPTVLPHSAIVEAFPNAFLGVAIPDEVYRTTPKLPRGAKFDWLYDQWIQRELFSAAVIACGLPLELNDRLVAERDHEKRAALVCLLTAAFAATGQAVVIGEAHTGYFFLPSNELWAVWSREAVGTSARIV